MDQLVLKLILIALMFLLSVVCGLLPLKLLQFLRKRAASTSELEEEKRWPSLLLCLVTCFSGGVFLATCFLHLLPEVTEKMQEIIHEYNWPHSYPFAELISCAGFFLVFLIEELVILCLRGGHHHHNHHGGGGHHHRSGSVVHVHVVQSPSSKSSADSKAKVSAKATFQLDDEPEERAELKSLTAHCSGRENGISVVSGGINSDLKATTFPLLPSCGENCPGIELPLNAEPECCEGPFDGRKEDPPIMMAYRPHAHSHGVRSITLVIALSCHSLIEGLAFGIQDTATSTTALFLGIIIHKCIIIFSTGVQLARTHAHQLVLVVLTIVLLSLMSPIGAGIGVAVEQSWGHSEARDVTIMFFSGLSVGTFLYVTFFEVLIHERDNEHNNLWKLFAILVGFILMAALRAMEGKHSHGTGADHANSTIANAFGNTTSTTVSAILN